MIVKNNFGVVLRMTAAVTPSNADGGIEILGKLADAYESFRHRFSLWRVASFDQWTLWCKDSYESFKSDASGVKFFSNPFHVARLEYEFQSWNKINAL
jgi:hypothetical protein